MKRISGAVLAAFFLFFLCAVCRAENWNSQKSSHFIVYYKNAPADFIEDVMEAAEEYYRSVTRDLGFTRYNEWSWEDRASIYIYNDKEEYLKATTQPSWSAGLASSHEKKIITFPQESGFFDTLLPHELGHLIFREFAGYRADIPRWLEEGVAYCQVRTGGFVSTEIVKKAMRDKKFIPLTDLDNINLPSAQDKEKIDLFYAEAGNAVYFLLTKFSRNNFVDLCKALKEGKSFNHALHAGYPRFDNLEELNKEWIRFLENE